MLCVFLETQSNIFVWNRQPIRPT